MKRLVGVVAGMCVAVSAHAAEMIVILDAIPGGGHSMVEYAFLLCRRFVGAL